MAMLGKRRPSRPASGHSGLVRQPSRKTESKDDISTTLVVERLAHDGRGVAHNVEGKTVFIDQALPGEHVDVAIHVTRKRYDEAHIKNRLTSSEQRVEPPCAYFGQCGGCDLQHLNLTAQRQHKRDVVTELMARQGITLGPIAALDGSSEHYRRRARLGVRVDGQGNVLLGFRAPNSHRLVDIEQCHVLVPALNKLILPLRQLLATLASPRLVGHVELLATDEATVVLVRQLKAHDQDRARWQQFAEQQQVSLGTWLGRETPVLHWNGAHGGATPVLQEVLNLDELGIQRASSPTSEHCLSGDKASSLVTLRFSPGDFLQVNAEVNQKMVAQVVAWLKPAPGQQLVDLFAGIGNFSLPLAAAGAKVLAVEGNPAMVERITANADANLLDVHAQQADLSDAKKVQMLLSEHQQIDAIVLDPPRSGAEAACQVLGSYNVPRVAYISCDPATLARDAAHLVHAGYRVKQVAVADMFLHTAHLETLMLFEYEG
ncbi:MAG: TRAM domain-containing protein [Halomonas sp.]|nr:TRAM domain-containing protein [Halomonas sp.]MCD6437658.1 TRAM domain-containing protein [Halomonas sp.]